MQPRDVCGLLHIHLFGSRELLGGFEALELEAERLERAFGQATGFSVKQPRVFAFEEVGEPAHVL